MSNIKELIRQEIERLENMDYPCDTSEQATGFYNALDCLSAFIDSLPEDASCVYDTNKLTPTPSVNIEDVARVQFASHAKVFDKKRKAVFDWEQFKEVAGIFYGFGKKNSLPEEKPSEDLEKAAKEYATTHLRNNEFPTADSAFIAGARWQKAKDDEETADLMFIAALDAGQRARESSEQLPRYIWDRFQEKIGICSEGEE